jgi:Spy/CpxP family protein refolding chaperone
MKKILLSMLALFIVISIACAQNPKEPSHRRHFHYRNKLSKELNFTDQQKDQLKSISRDYHQKLLTLNQDESITVKEMRDRKATFSHDYHQAFQNILTQEQKDKLNDMRKRMEDKRKMMAEKKLDKMKEKLNLTDEQTTKIRELNDKYRDQYKKYLGMDGSDRSAKREELLGLRKQQKADIDAVLTSDQQKQLDDWQKNKTGRF